MPCPKDLKDQARPVFPGVSHTSPAPASTTRHLLPSIGVARRKARVGTPPGDAVNVLGPTHRPEARALPVPRCEAAQRTTKRLGGGGVVPFSVLTRTPQIPSTPRVLKHVAGDAARLQEKGAFR